MQNILQNPKGNEEYMETSDGQSGSTSSMQAESQTDEHKAQTSRQQGVRHETKVPCVADTGKFHLRKNTREVKKRFKFEI